MKLPQSHVQPKQTGKGTYYLTEPGVAMLAAPIIELENMDGFIKGFDTELHYGEYLDDPVELSAADQLCKSAGQLCYQSFAPTRTWNEKASQYFKNIKESGHGSVLEHPCFSFLLYGISRSLTHELVRHRTGVAFSQTSQRYCNGSAVRFVERPEYQTNTTLHALFIEYIDKAMYEYDKRAELLMAEQLAGNPIMSGERKTDLRKKVNQSARSVLPNETEAPMVFTANGRSLRHILEMRCAAPAETEIRALAYKLFLQVRQVAPLLFEDYTVETLNDGTQALKTPYRKV